MCLSAGCPLTPRCRECETDLLFCEPPCCSGPIKWPHNTIISAFPSAGVSVPSHRFPHFFNPALYIHLSFSLSTPCLFIHSFLPLCFTLSHFLLQSTLTIPFSLPPSCPHSTLISPTLLFLETLYQSIPSSKALAAKAP